MKLIVMLATSMPTFAYAHAGHGEGFLRGLQHALLAVFHGHAHRIEDRAYGAGFLIATALLLGLGIGIGLLIRRIRQGRVWS